MATTVTFADVAAARERLDESVVQETPVDRSRSLSRVTGASVFLKMEHLQRTGSFKTRGAYNKIRHLADAGDVERVVAASAGNHAQGVALAASTVGVPSTVVMPADAPQSKVDATREYGAEVLLEPGTFQDSLTRAREFADANGAAFVHAYDDPDVVAGQGTLGLELFDQLPDVDTVVVPVGGGGLIGGVATAAKGVNEDIRVVGVQAEMASTVPQSLAKGEPVSNETPSTIADGIATGGISRLTYELIEAHVDEVVTVSDDRIAEAILVLLERAKQLVEGGGAVSVAALLSDELDLGGETVVPVLSGGNIDPAMLQTVLTHAMTDREQLVRFRVRIRDRPGKMENISGIIGSHGANIQNVRHDRSVDDLRVGEAVLVFEVVTAGHEHAAAVESELAEAGHQVERAN